MMNASDFKAKCLAIIDEVGNTGDRIVISKRGKPVAELVKYIDVEEGIPQMTLRGSGRCKGDIEDPVVSNDTWKSVGEV